MDKSQQIALDDTSSELLADTTRLIETMYGEQWSSEEIARHLTTYAFMRGSYTIATFAKDELRKHDELDDEQRRLCNRIIGRAVAASAELAETGFVE